MAHPTRGPWPALLYLWRHSLWNRWRSWVGRLRQPRYAIAFLLGLAYFGWFGSDMARSNSQIQPEMVNLAADFLPVLTAIITAAWWVGSRSYMVLAFTPPEVQFLFQGPISRRTLLDYKLLRAQPRILLLVALLTLMGRALAPLPWPLLAVGLWLVIATAHLHQVAAGLVRTSWTQHGAAGLRRQWLPLAVIVAATLVMAATLASAVAALGRASTSAEFAAVLNAVLARPAPSVVLWPFRILVAPLLAPDPGAWALAMLGAAVLWGLHYVWVVRIDAAFEETAARAGTERQAMLSAVREGRGLSLLRAQRKGRIAAPWFRLRPTGHPAVAVFWKNLTAFTRNLSTTGVVGIALLFVGFRVLMAFIAQTPREAALAAAVLPGMMAVMAIFMGPMFLRNDLRTDFQRQELVRTFPLSGRAVVAAEVGGSTASLTLVVVSLLTLTAAFLAFPHMELPRPWMLPAGWLTAVAAAAPLCLLVMCIQNGLAVLYPAWARLGPTQQHGLDQMGTMILVMVSTLVLLAIGLLPPLLVGAVVGFRLFVLLGAWAAVPAAAAAWLALAAEGVGVVVLLGEAYDRMDPSEAGLLD
ncbi:MAG: putative ABC exporter domain-containing protein [Gemmatimonadota bacterium]